MSWGPTPKVKGPKHRQVFRSTTGIILGGLILLFLVAGLVDAIVSGSWHFLGQAVPWLLLLGWAVVLFWIRPAVIITDDGIEVYDLLRRFTISWQALRLVVHQYLLTLITKDGSKVQCFAAPAPASQRHPRRQRPGQDADQSERSVPLKSIIEARWAAALGGPIPSADIDHVPDAAPQPGHQSGHQPGHQVDHHDADVVGPRGMERRWDWPIIISGVALLLWGIGSVIWL